ncbi:putative coatomer subunit beta'-3 [Cornus florida]|uniref:putative coatomer subunit beta'-3 n=1 Tax=Cornus florida TaxID=4283 RepID=UPI0028967544|nr:putative coatomer subunit beta'-3 [Cornus florida]XP_059645496.1 putative coatomer subunit beta'-3 [Cornus florida]XP_059645497.1 putative coatomer subunit beta'-3 [Cornus florida]XP_059645499.1 putative coatomer subunit beta'-3 [Cornus florida]XP_059645500.1 putative coatomer subunit beta'-3 [Cornus florida]XP_059645501.1 putative coatomer subunit beta'-3 [Cornus florida]XP_059645502.1 putative coatomer subunit beta'-3 [Cornus florida]XP_059645503.1 putative coatomer subunit beta'-3 [Cor
MIKIFNQFFQEKRATRYREFKSEDNEVIASKLIKRLFGGPLLTICEKFQVHFHDWDKNQLIRTFHDKVKAIYWSESKKQVVYACASHFVLLKYDVLAPHCGFRRSAGRTIRLVCLGGVPLRRRRRRLHQRWMVTKVGGGSPD